MKPKTEPGRTQEPTPGPPDTAPGIEPATPLPSRHPNPERGPLDWFRAAPFLQLILYYLVLIALVGWLALQVPAIRQALFAPVVLPALQGGETALLTGEMPVATGGLEPERLDQVLERSLGTLLVILGALALVIPTARVYMQTKRLQYDPALVRSVIILPIVVAGIALVVKNSIALAFSLAGIVAAVRFRNTLKDPRDAVYIFLVIGIGLSAGVQALDVALVMSLLFNFVVLALWKWNIGSVYSGRYGETGVIAFGDRSLLVAHAEEQRREIRRSLYPEAADIEADGVLLVHTSRPELARHTVQEALGELAKDWKLARIAPRDGAAATLQYLIRLKKKTSPTELVGALGERWSAQVAAAEYFWFRSRERDRPADDQDDD